MRARCGLLVVLAFTAACGSSSVANSAPAATQTSTTSPSPGAPACGPTSARTLAQNVHARVYEAGGMVYGCARGSARGYQLGSARVCIRSARAAPVALAGTVVAYGLERCGVDTGTAAVVVKELSTGRQLRDLPATTGQLGPESYQQVAWLVVKANGAAAWIGTASSIIHHGQTVEVHRADRRGATELDSGDGIAPRSLHLKGKRLTWRDSGALRSSTLL